MSGPARRPPFLRLVGNLDCELEWARQAGLPGANRRPPGMAQALATSALLMRALAEEGDSLWTPAPVDPARLAPLPGLPTPRLESGKGEKGEKVECPLLFWGEAADLNHRRFQLGLMRELGLALPGAEWVRDLRALEAHLAAGGADATQDGRWVLKAPWSAAGRSRAVGRGCLDKPDGRAGDGATRREVERLFQGFGAGGLLFEPWMDRTADYGCAAAVAAGDGGGSEPRILGLHRQIVDGRGRFHGVELYVGGASAPGLDPAGNATLREAALAVGRALARAGYRGPYGIDAWTYRAGVPGGAEGVSRQATGTEVLHPLGEVNVRWTLGACAHRLVTRLIQSGAEPLGLAFAAGASAVLRLRFGTPAVALPDPAEVAAGRAVPVVLPDADGTGAVWLSYLPVSGPCLPVSGGAGAEGSAGPSKL